MMRQLFVIVEGEVARFLDTTNVHHFLWIDQIVLDLVSIYFIAHIFAIWWVMLITNMMMI